MATEKVTTTLEQRGEVYGDYKGGSKFRADMMGLIRARHFMVNGSPIDPEQEMYIYDIVNKISRLASTPNHIDSYHDIAGYALLAEEALTNE